jgi:ATP-dependent Lon protease
MKLAYSAHLQLESDDPEELRRVLAFVAATNRTLKEPPAAATAPPALTELPPLVARQLEVLGATFDKRQIPAPTEAAHLAIEENQLGITYDLLFGAYLEGVLELTVIDPYVRMSHQYRNLLEFCQMLYRRRRDVRLITVNLQTLPHLETTGAPQTAQLDKVADEVADLGIMLKYSFVPNLHARRIITPNWVIRCDRGLDIWQSSGPLSDILTLACSMQEFRICKNLDLVYMPAASDTGGPED